MLETLSADFIRTAHAKGLSSRTVVMRHALKGGLLPVVSYSARDGGHPDGSLVIERIFFIPGTGSHFINALRTATTHSRWASRSSSPCSCTS